MKNKPKQIQSLKQMKKEDAQSEKLIKKMENSENDPESALDAVIKFLNKYGKSRGY